MRRAAIPLLLLFPLALAGCGGSTPASPDAGSSGPAATSGANQPAGNSGYACPDQATVGSALGSTYDAPDVESGYKNVVCMYRGHKVAGNDASVVTLTIRDGAQAEMDQLRKDETDSGYTIKDLSGVGDEAFSFEIPGFKDPIENVAARVGDREVYVAADGTFDQVVALVKQLL
jgi:hypothetical protein